MTEPAVAEEVTETVEDIGVLLEEVEWPTNWWPTPKWTAWVVTAAAGWATAFVEAGQELSTELKTAGITVIAGAILAYIIPDRR